MAIAVTACGLGIAVYSPSRWGAALGGGLVGGGVASMHYTGMWAMYLPGWIMWEMDLVVASIAARNDARHCRDRGRRARRKVLLRTLAAALLLTLAIVSHHFTAIGAVMIIPDPTRTIAPLSLSSNGLALSVAATAFVLLAMALVGAFADRASEKKARKQNLLFEAALEQHVARAC